MYGVAVNVLVAIMLLSLGAVDECVSGLHMYPEIFDPSKFLARPLPLKSARPSAAGDHHLARGFQDDETGFVRSNSESGKTGFIHRENFHRKDGNKYGSEKQTGHGESRRSEEPIVGTLKGVHTGDEAGRIVIETDHYRPEPMYEVTEEQTSDYENPDKHKKYGSAAKPTPAKEEGDKKKKMAEKQMKASGRALKEATSGGRKPRKGGRSNQQNNHNGYESIVYHENEHDSMEQGYGKRKAVGKLPGTKQTRVQADPVPQGRLLEDEDEEYEEGRGDGDDEDEYDEETRHSDHANADDDDEGRGNDSDFGDNYDAVRFDSDFERSFGDGPSFDNHNAGGKGGKKGNGKDYDYDEEVDREQVDESASEDKYRGDDESDEEEEGDGERDDDDGRQYEYASEADSDAQDY